MVGRPGSSSFPGGALRPRTTTTETNALGTKASVIGTLIVCEPEVMRMRRWSITCSRSTVTHASASVKGDAIMTVAVSPTA